MKVKRFTAANMQTALRQVTAQLGADAVIISTKTLPEGIEVVAAIDYQPQNAAVEIERQLQLQHELEQSRKQLLAAGTQQKSVRKEQPIQVDVSTHEGLVAALNQIKNPQASALQAATVAPPAAQMLNTSAPSAVSDSYQQALAQVQDELAALKNLMTNHVNATPKPLTTSSLAAELRTFCKELGIASSWAKQLIKQVTSTDPSQASKQILQVMAQELPVSLYKMFERGGMFALVGPTGAGKTTTLGKIAAQFVMRHGASSVALVTLDNYRVAAHDQLRSFARILGVELHIVAPQGDVSALLDKLSHKKLVLVDSAGLVKNDPHFSTQLAMLRKTEKKLKKLLVLPLTSHSEGLQENYNSFKLVGLSGCIFTKLDECFNLGAALSVATLGRLPITLITDGPHIPDDIHYPNAAKLVQQAEQMAQMAQTRRQAKQDMRTRTHVVGKGV